MLSLTEGKKYILLIEGSYGNTEVWVNGNLAALHHYGYTEFHVDITPWLKYNEENKLKIVVENNALPNSRWYTGSGLYRHVYLCEGEQNYLDPWSVWIKTPDLQTIEAEAEITNDGETGEYFVKMTIYDEDYQPIFSKCKQMVCHSGKNKCGFVFHSDALNVWDVDHPYLYTAKVEVWPAAEQETEKMESHMVSFGVRTISFDRENGFCLNGKPLKLKGGCIHHDNGIAGSCAYSALEERKVRLLKSSGYNAIRTSHNPMSTALLNACDRLGVLVMDEAFDSWRAKKTAYDYHLYFEKCWKEDLQSMILRDRNHPSVIMYSIGNEIGERDGSSNGPEIAREMSRFTKSLDDTRAVTNGVCAVFLDAGEFGGILANIFGSGEKIDFDSIPDEVKAFIHQTDYVTEHWGDITAPFVEELDVVGYNYLDDRYEKDGKQFPDRLIVGTESYPKAMKTVWERTMAHSYVLGDFTWTAFDYLGESGIGHAFYDQKGSLFCDYPWHMGNCGDYDICGFIRPQGKFRKLLWDVEKGPIVTVLRPEHMGKEEVVSSWGWPDVVESYTWPGYEGKEIRLDIYSKAEEVEISINDRIVKREKMPDTNILQTIVVYEPGILKVTEYTSGEQLESCILNTVAPAKHLCMTVLNENTEHDDVVVIVIEATDNQGNRDTSYSGTIRCVLGNNAVLIGMGTGNPVGDENYTEGICDMYEGRALLIVKKEEQDKDYQISVESVEGDLEAISI